MELGFDTFHVAAGADPESTDILLETLDGGSSFVNTGLWFGVWVKWLVCLFFCLAGTG